MMGCVINLVRPPGCANDELKAATGVTLEDMVFAHEFLCAKNFHDKVLCYAIGILFF